MGEYRGSTTIERFIDPNEKTTAGVNIVPDAAAQVGLGYSNFPGGLLQMACGGKSPVRAVITREVGPIGFEPMAC